MTSTAGRGRCAKSVLAAKPPPHSLQDVVNQGRMGEHDVGFLGIAYSTLTTILHFTNSRELQP